MGDKKKYETPAVIHEYDLETKAGSPGRIEEIDLLGLDE